MVTPHPAVDPGRRPAGLPAKATQTATLPNVLLTGFDAFGDAAINPSWLVAQALRGHRIAGHRVVAAQLPTVFGESARVLAALLKLHRPALVICLGLAGGRGAISLERVAINVNDARIADNAGAQPLDSAVAPDGPAAYFTSLPIKAMLRALQARGIAAEVSQTAGTFVCNHVFYALMHRLATTRGLKKVRGGFIHLPWLPEQARQHNSGAGMPLDDMLHGIKLALRAALENYSDIALSAGATH